VSWADELIYKEREVILTKVKVKKKKRKKGSNIFKIRNTFWGYRRKSPQHRMQLFQEGLVASCTPIVFSYTPYVL